MSETPSLRTRIGGRWAISVRGWFVIALITIVPTTFGAPIPDDSPARRAAQFALAVVAWLCLGLVLLIAARTLFRHRTEHPVPIWWLALLGVPAGLVYTMVAASLSRMADFGEAGDPVSRLVLAPFLGPAMLVVIALALDGIDRYGRERNDLLRRAADLRTRVVERGELTRSIEAAVNDEIAAATRVILGDLDRAHGDMTAEERLEMARTLQRTAHQELRPLSQRLYATPPEPLPGAGIGESLRAVLGAAPVSIGWSSIVIAIATLLYAQGRSTMDHIALQTVLQGVITLASLWLAVRLGTRQGRRKAWLLPIAGVVAGVATTAKSAMLQTAGITSPDVTVMIVNFVWVPTVTIIVSLIAASLTGRDESLLELEYEIDEQALEAILANRELVRVSRELASHVHGTLQSTLLATAFAIENATRKGDGAAFDAAVEGARAALADAYSGSRTAADIHAEVQRHVDLWSEFTEISTTIADVGELPPAVIADVGLIVEEGIGNAKKHGRARRIHIAIETAAPGALRISISDDGTGPALSATGLGSVLLDQLAPGSWSLRANPAGAGSLLIADLPVA